MQLARLRQGDKGIKQSSVEYLINQEADSISGIIKSMFTNSSPFSTDLQVELIKIQIQILINVIKQKLLLKMMRTTNCQVYIQKQDTNMC